jgi:hypothetical protein
MAKITEVIDSLNDVNVSDMKAILKSEAEALEKQNKQLFIRAKKAEGFEWNKDSKEWVKKEIIKPNEPPKSDELINQPSNEPNYSQLAFLEGRGIKNPDDQKIVQEEAKRLKLPLTDILGMEHIQSKLKDAANQREAEAGMPQGGGSGGGSTKNSVDYWLNKTDKDGNYVSPDDPVLHQQVVNERIKQNKKKSMFSDDKF